MIVSGATIGALNGVAVAYLRMIPFVVTLATMTIAKDASIGLYGAQSASRVFPRALATFCWRVLWGIPVAVLATIALTLLASTALSFTVIGRWLYAIGVNERAARVARVPIERVTAMSYVAAGLSAGVAALLLAALFSTRRQPTWATTEWSSNIVSACAVGGISIYGGIGRSIRGGFRRAVHHDRLKRPELYRGASISASSSRELSLSGTSPSTASQEKRDDRGAFSTP